jgi:hypothetical protein
MENASGNERARLLFVIVIAEDTPRFRNRSPLVSTLTSGGFKRRAELRQHLIDHV